MGYRSNVKILMANKAYELLKKNCLASDKDYVRDMVLKPDSFETSEEHGGLPDNSIMINWSGCKWYSSYEDVKSVENTLTELNTIVENDGNLLHDYFYKKIAIGEDNACSEVTNDEDDEFVYDFFVNCCFSL